MSQLSPIHLLQRRLASLLLYQSVFDSETGEAFRELLQTLQRHQDGQPAAMDSLQAYGRWFKLLVAEGISWQAYILTRMLSADNPFTQQVQRTAIADLPPALIRAVQQDLRSLQSLYACTAQQLSEWVQSAAQLPDELVAWDLPLEPSAAADASTRSLWSKLQQAEDWAIGLEALVDYYRQAGVGLFGSYQALRWQSGTLVGVAYPDPIQLDELVGYAAQKAALIKNTEALLAGYPALHVLLYGSRGSGKSSLVKALLHRYASQGLRLIEVTKADLTDLPAIADFLREVPQKFILFVDDLSFEEDEDAYKALKVVLEGSVTARPQNIVVYATSNRRHLIREFFGDRPRPSDADEVHAWDTVQEKLSFSDRFGLTLTFEPADQKTYLEIIHHLARQANLAIDPQELEFRALQWATRHNGRSGRSARQFVDFLRSELAT